MAKFSSRVAEHCVSRYGVQLYPRALDGDNIRGRLFLLRHAASDATVVVGGVRSRVRWPTAVLLRRLQHVHGAWLPRAATADAIKHVRGTA